MSERDGQIERDVDIDTGIDKPVDRQREVAESADEDDDSTIKSKAGSVVSTTGLVVAVALTLGGALLLGGLPIIGAVGELLGILAGGFMYGLATDARRYVELATAGALVGGGFALLGNLAAVLLVVGIPLLAFGVVGGTVAGVLGHYFGRDLRDGLTREL